MSSSDAASLLDNVRLQNPRYKMEMMNNSRAKFGLHMFEKSTLLTLSNKYYYSICICSQHLRSFIYSSQSMITSCLLLPFHLTAWLQR